MKNKHIQNAGDTELLKKICKAVDEKLIINKQKTALLMLAKFIVYFSLVVIFYTLLFQLNNPIIFCLAYISFGLSSILFAFNFAHDFSHNTIFKSINWNNFGYMAIYTMVGAHAESWKYRHVHSHHFAPNVEGQDSDLKISKLIRVIPNSKHYWFNRYQHLYAPIAYTSYSLFWVFIKDFYILFSNESKGKNKNIRYQLSFWIQKAVYVSYILLIPLIFSKQHEVIVLLGFLLMHLAQSLFLLFTFFITHHVESMSYPTTNDDGFINSSWLMNQIKSSNDFYPFSNIANFIFGGFNNHIAHHIFPNIHHLHYPQLSRILYQTLSEHKITPNQTTYFGGVMSHLRLLKSMSR